VLCVIHRKKKFRNILIAFILSLLLKKNVRLDLCVDDFTPFFISTPSYSCCVLFSLKMCMTNPYIFLSLLSQIAPTIQRFNWRLFVLIDRRIKIIMIWRCIDVTTSWLCTFRLFELRNDSQATPTRFSQFLMPNVSFSLPESVLRSVERNRIGEYWWGRVLL